MARPYREIQQQFTVSGGEKGRGRNGRKGNCGQREGDTKKGIYGARGPLENTNRWVILQDTGSLTGPSPGEVAS